MRVLVASSITTNYSPKQNLISLRSQKRWLKDVEIRFQFRFCQVPCPCTFQFSGSYGQRHTKMRLGLATYLWSLQKHKCEAHIDQVDSDPVH